MSQNKNTNWVRSSALLYLAVFINIAVVIAAYIADQNLFWILSASVPLLIITIYIGQLQNVFFKPLNGFFKRDVLSRLRYSFQYDKIKETDLKLIIGNEQCRKPFNACFFNVETKKEQQSTSSDKPGRQKNNSYYLADEGRVWQIGPDYAGCRTKQGNFNCEVFKEHALRSEIKMIELNLSPQVRAFNSVKADKNVSDIACNSKSIFYEESAYNVFRNAEAMILFIKKLRDLSGGKPVGVRLAPDNKKDFYSICHAICKTQIIPDFIVVEELSDDADKLHLSLYEALLFVGETLRHYRIQSKIKIIASGKISSAFDILKLLSLGANGVWAIKHDDKKNAGIFYSGEMSVPSYKDLYRTTLKLMRSLKFTNVNDITLANFFSKLKIGQPETLSMQNNINLFFDQAVKPEIFKISSVKTKDKNEMSAILKKTQKEMSF